MQSASMYMCVRASHRIDRHTRTYTHTETSLRTGEGFRLRTYDGSSVTGLTARDECADPLLVDFGFSACQ